MVTPIHFTCVSVYTANVLTIFVLFSVKFHIAHLFEVQGKIKGAKERYELLLRDKTITNSLRADIFRQLGELGFFF